MCNYYGLSLLCPTHRHHWVQGPWHSYTRRPPHCASPSLERCVILGTYPPLSCLPVSSTMTPPSIEQVVTLINRVQNAVEVVRNILTSQNRLTHFCFCLQISTSHKQSLESWTPTQDALNNLMTLVRRCSEKDCEMGSELHQPLSDLQTCVYTYFDMRTSSHPVQLSPDSQGPRRNIYRMPTLLPHQEEGCIACHSRIT
jgi:hypothetical protein